MTGVDTGRIERAVRELLLAIGEDPDRPGLERTPRRVAEAYAEYFSGIGADPQVHLADSVDIEVRTLIEQAHDEAWQVLNDNRDILDRLAAELLENETLDQHQIAAIFKDVRKLPPRPLWLSSDRRPVSDRPPIAFPTAKAPIDQGAVDGGVDSGDTPLEEPAASRAQRSKPRPATA